jgi:hypothetical protein
MAVEDSWFQCILTSTSWIHVLNTTMPTIASHLLNLLEAPFHQLSKKSHKAKIMNSSSSEEKAEILTASTSCLWGLYPPGEATYLSPAFQDVLWEDNLSSLWKSHAQQKKVSAEIMAIFFQS